MQQPPYNQPIWPPGPPPRLLPHQRYWRWFRSRNIVIQLLLSLLILSGLLCTCVLSVAASAIHTTPTAQTAIPTDTPTDTPQALLVATDTPTDTPVPTDTPSPTPAPTATPTPKSQPTQVPRPTPTPAPHCSGVNGNPWCYDFNPGKLIYVPPSGFCGYFACIPTFYAPDDPGDGYIIQCVDSTYSQSGGERGACSSHGGESRPLYSH
jgi:hypothetical protein